MTRRAASFDALARPYRWLEYLTFGRSLERCRKYFLPRFAACRRALVLGDGDGRFVSALLATNPQIEADAVDGSASMLRELERRAASAASRSRLRTHHANALGFMPDGPYDLVASHFFLDCLTQEQVEALCARVAPHLAPEGMWVVSEFRIPHGPMRWPARVIVRLLYLGFRVLAGLRVKQLPDHAAAFQAAGLMRSAQSFSLGGILTAELWQREEYTFAMLLPQRLSVRAIADPVPDPEPASPSLPEPDPGVYHHEPGAPAPKHPKPDVEETPAESP
jgi:ubiquinone/menaquinone biosynthesis C-methylase UbiE